MANMTTSPSQMSSMEAAARSLRVLVVDEELPWPLNSGKRLRSWNLISRLARTHSIDWLCFGPVTEEASAAARAAGIEVVALPPLAPDRGFMLAWRLVAHLFTSFPYSVFKHDRKDMRDAIAARCKTESYDLVHIEWSPYAKYLDVVPRNVKKLVVAHNVESQIWERRAAIASNPLSQAFFGLQAKRMAAFERERLTNTDIVIAVSENDKKTLAAWGARTATVPNGVDLDFYDRVSPASNSGANLLFLASLDWFPNVDALRFFTAEIFPLIRRSQPDVRLRIVGRRLPATEAASLSNMCGVDVIGEVDDVRDELGRASIVVVPLRIGGGSRLKILEAMAARRAVVSTTIGAEGIDALDGIHIRIANQPQPFAEAVLGVIEDHSFRHRLEQNARMLVEQRYGWDRLAEKMSLAWLDAAHAEVRS